MTDGTNWMSDNLDTLGKIPLNKLVMPASHDSGMYVVLDPSPQIEIGKHGPFGANASNTQTQTCSIKEQLENGSRYFDIRPVIYNSTLHTGHYAIGDQNGTKNRHGPVFGANGPKLSDFFTQVTEFMEKSSDLVILKFSHYFDRDNNVEGFNSSQFQSLISLVESNLGGSLFHQAVPAGGLASMTLSSFLNDGGKVLTVYEFLPASLHAPTEGTYSYIDAPGNADLVVFDSYADKNTVEDMAADQLAKLTNPANHNGNLFLLSWTLTQDTGQAIVSAVLPRKAKSILDLASEADPQLQPTLEDWLKDGSITETQIPNLLYVDNNDSFSLDAALWLNQQLNSN